MAPNMVSGSRPAAWIAPFAAPIGGLPLYCSLQHELAIPRAFDFVFWPVLIAYFFMWVFVAPILTITRSKIAWTPPLILLLGTGLAILPIAAVFAWEGVVAMIAGNGTSYIENISFREWSVFLSFLVSGLSVAGAFIGIQRLYRSNAI